MTDLTLPEWALAALLAGIAMLGVILVARKLMKMK